MDDRYVTPKLMVATGNAAIRHLYARTATFVNTRDHPVSNLGRWEIFSGTIVEIKHRLLVATVSHSLGDFENPTRYVLTRKNGQPHPDGAAIVLRTFGTDRNHPDVGIMELDKEMFQAFEGLEAVDIARISVAPPDSRLASLMGTPSETVKIHPTEDGNWGISGTLAGFSTAAVNVHEWPEVPPSYTPLNAKIDLLAKYPNDSLNIRDSAGTRTLLPNPKGKSGGGLWIHDIDQQDDLWLPEKCQLVGIQSKWWEELEYVRLARISCWLDLVYSKYPDLRTTIDEIIGYSFGGT